MKNQFSPSEAAVSFFEFVKVHPKFTLKYCLIFGIINFITIMALFNTGYKDMVVLMTSPDFNPNDPTALMNLYKSMDYWTLIPALIFSMLLGVLTITMGLRKTVLNQETGFFGLNFGKDEINYIKANLVIGIIAFLFMLLAMLVTSVLINIPVVGTLVPIVIVCVWCFSAVKISMFGIYSIANKTMGIKESWEATKKDYWSYLGAFILNAIIVMIGSLIIMSIIGAMVGSLNTQELGKAANQQELLEQLFSINTVAYLFINGIVSGFANLALICTGAYIYHRTRPEEGQNLDIKI